MTTAKENNMTFWKSPYISSGLVAMWDAYYNAGPGMHTSEQVLVEVISRTPTFLRQGKYTVSENCLILDKAVIASKAIPAMLSLTGGECTIECIGCLGGNDNERLICFDEKPFTGGKFFTSNNTYWMSHNACTDGFLDSKWDSGYKVNQCCARSLTVSKSHVTWFIDGIMDASALKTKDIEVTSEDFAVVGWDFSFNFPAYGKFCSLRIYNRALAPEEITKNYATDKERFGI